MMARGWESKSVEDQKEAASAAKDAREAYRLTPEQRERKSKRQSLLLSRAQTVARLQKATNLNYRAQLEAALKDLDEQLRKLE